MGHRLTARERDRRRQIICAQLAGQCTARAAAAELGISESRYYVLRKAVVAALDAALVAKPAGRPATPPPHPAEARVAELQAQLAQAKLDLECADVRTAIALAMPEVVAGAAARAKPPKPSKPATRRKKGGSRGHK